MKRVVRSDIDIERLRYIDNKGNSSTLPLWFVDKSDEELDRIKEVLQNAESESESLPEDSVFIPPHFRRDLRLEGFSNEEIDEIIAMVENGHSIDSAIQRQLMLSGKLS